MKDKGTPKKELKTVTDATPYEPPSPKLKEKDPTWEDFLILYPTVTEHVAWRSPINGSYLVRQIDKVFREFAHMLDLKELLDELAFAFRDVQEPDSGFKQMPCYEVRGFYHKLYFNPKALAKYESPKLGRLNRNHGDGTNFKED